MEKVWFKRKKYGYGWYPATWQGWAVLLEFILFVFCNFIRIHMNAASGTEVASIFIPQTIVATVALITICCLKGESPHWQWGEKPVAKSRVKKKKTTRK